MTGKPLFKILGVALIAAGEMSMPDPNSYGAVGWVLLSLGALLFILNQGADFISRFTKKQLKGDEAPISRREWREVNDARDATMRQIQEDIRELLQRTAPDAGYGRRK